MTRLVIVLLIVSLSGVVLAEADVLRARVIDSETSRQPTLTIAPEYPRKARRDRLQGEVQVCFDIDRKGRPHRVSVRRSTHRWFERPSIRAVRASKFEPLADGVAPQSIKTCRIFVFSLVREDAGA